MSTYLFTWNPKQWQWNELEDAVQEVKDFGDYSIGWACASTRQIKVGDRAFLIKIGPEEPRGIVGSGYINSEPYSSEDFNDTQRSSMAVEIKFDQLLNPYKDPILPINLLNQGNLSAQKWTPQASGISIRPEIVNELEHLWLNFLSTGNFRYNPFIAEEEISPRVFTEGLAYDVTQTRYERSKEARTECIKHWGSSCFVCGFDFEKAYGTLGKEFIHVHHLNQVALAGGQYQIDPVKDLRPVCPNCHSMLHRKKEVLSIEELKSQLLFKILFDE